MKKVFVNSLPKSDTNLIAIALDLFGFHHTYNLDSGLFLRDKWQNRVRCLLNRPSKQGYIIGEKGEGDSSIQKEVLTQISSHRGAPKE